MNAKYDHNLIPRLENPEQCMDAIDDAISEIETLRKIVFAVEKDSKGMGYLSLKTVEILIAYCAQAQA